MSGGLFGGPSSTSITAGGLFGGPPKPAGESSTATTTPATGGFFSLPPKPVDSAAASTSTLTTTPALGAGLFGGATLIKGATKPEEKKDATPATATSLSGPPKDGEKKDGVAAGTSALFGFFGKPDEKKDTLTSERTTLFYHFFVADSGSVGTISTDDKSKVPGTSSALTITAQPPSMLRGKTIEEIVNKWSSDLEVQVKEFSKFAMEVAVWDRALIDNGNNVSLRFTYYSLTIGLYDCGFRLAGNADERDVGC